MWMCWIYFLAAIVSCYSWPAHSSSSAPNDDFLNNDSRESDFEYSSDFHWPESYFDLEASSDVAVLVGHTAFLTCRVQVAGNWTEGNALALAMFQVSWVRHRDIHLLTVGTDTYTADRRFRGLHAPGSAEWTLQIKGATMEDAGDYECQLSSTPLRTHVVHLQVMEPRIQILHSPEVYVHEGSSLNLTCVINPAVDSSLLLWSHNGQVLNWLYQGSNPDKAHINVYDGRLWEDRGGMAGRNQDTSSQKDSGSRTKVKEDIWQTSTVSQLLIPRTQLVHSGRYVCGTFASTGADVLVHVLAEEQPAAMQRGNAHSVPAPWITWLLLTCQFLYYKT